MPRPFSFGNGRGTETQPPKIPLQLSSPASLTSREAFAQAKAVLRQTTRATNPDWYRDALGLDHQWHLVVQGGSRISSALFHRVAGAEPAWLAGPSVQLSVLPTLDQVEAMLDAILANPEFRKARSLGVVVHLADEFATTEILNEVRSSASLAELRDEVLRSPASALGDPSLSNDTTATRLVPYAGATQPPLAATVTLSRTHEPFVDLLRTAGEVRNFPVQVTSLSAPLVFLSIVPAFLQFQAERPHFVLLHYPKFSALAVFNGEANLVQLRALPHRGRPFPGNLGDAVNTALDSLDLHDPVITILPLGDVDPSPLLTQLHATLNQPESAEVRVMRPSADAVAPGVTDLRPEMLVSVPQFASGEVSPGFKQLFTERWALQDFLPLSPEVAALYPSASEMKLLRLSRVMLAVLAFAMVGLLGLGIYSLLGTVNDPSWKHNREDTVALGQRLAKATQDAKEFEHWDNLLQQRSKGWLAMELLTRLFPEDSGVVVKTFKHAARLDSAIKNKKVGFTREWTISGMAQDKAVPLLNQLNGREGMKALFDRVYKATGNASFDVSVPGRNFTVTVDRAKKPGSKSAADSLDAVSQKYPYVFDLKITQMFPSEDPMAITTSALGAK